MSEAITRLNAALEGRYRIESELGEGGMATVYLADDIKHERKVALKVLKPELAAIVGAERFLAEIKTTANLTHPHILPLHDSGEADSFLFYVMPFVRGESLRDRIDRDRQFPVDEAVRIASAVANALDYAHREGVIHRDIKPGNILLQDGEPVVADFGIALAVGSSGSRLTETGVSVGTPWYMSPEQATGDQAVGPASDTYSLAAVLYEMLTGEPPHPGRTAQAVLGRIMRGAATPATELRAAVPAHVDAALRKGLERIPADRFTTTRAFADALGDPSFRYGSEPSGASSSRNGLWKPLSIGATAVAAGLAVALAMSLGRPDPERRVVRTSLDVVARALLPDGSGIVTVDTTTFGLAIRRFDEPAPRPIPGTTGLVQSFVFSPEGDRIAFVSGFPGELRTMSLEGGPAELVLPDIYVVQSWTERGIYFNTLPGGIQVVSDPDGDRSARRITELLPGETIHSTYAARDGARFGVFQVWYATDGSDAEIWALDVETGDRHLLLPGHSPRLTSTGQLLFVRDGILFAARFDGDDGTLIGPVVATEERITTETTFGTSAYSVSEVGDLLYNSVQGRVAAGLDRVSWSGEGVPIAGTETIVSPLDLSLRLSPDGSRAAVIEAQPDGNVDIWILHLESGTRSQLTFDIGDERNPSWSADGQFVIYARRGIYLQTGTDVWRRPSDGEGQPELLVESGRRLANPRQSPDGRWIVAGAGPATSQSIVGFDLEGDPNQAVEIVGGQDIDAGAGELSPDGRWLAYASDESGRYEVYVRAFTPGAGGPGYRISAEGGGHPRWTPSGDAVLYLEGGDLVRSDLVTSPELQVVQTRVLFGGWIPVIQAHLDVFDVLPDGMGIVTFGVPDLTDLPSVFVLVTNWLSELDELMGGG